MPDLLVIHPDGTTIVDYINGVCRNSQDEVRSHTYALDDKGELWPMCEYGWNRSDGAAFSIFRGHVSARGHCKICDKNEAKHRPPVKKAKGHKTKWL